MELMNLYKFLVPLMVSFLPLKAFKQVVMSQILQVRTRQ